MSEDYQTLYKIHCTLQRCLVFVDKLQTAAHIRDGQDRPGNTAAIWGNVRIFINFVMVHYRLKFHIILGYSGLFSPKISCIPLFVRIGIGLYSDL